MRKLIVRLMTALMMATTTMPARAEGVQSADAIVDEQVAAEEQVQQSDVEWKYVSVRRYAAAESDTNYFDGRLLTADDLAHD